MPVLLALALLLPPSPACATPPVAGPILYPFSPGPGFGGHWGVDLGAAPDTPVRAAMAGTVTFAGLVVDNPSITVHHGGGLRTSYSFLAGIDVSAGAPVRAGEPIGRTGVAHGNAALHFSLRLADRYLDPAGLFACRAGPGRALRLVSSPRTRTLYAVRRAARNPGRNLRSTSCGPSHGRRGGAPSARPRRDHVHHRR